MNEYKLGEALLSEEAMVSNVSVTNNRVSINRAEDYIVRTEFIRPDIADTLTICVAVLENGFVVVGKSACVDPRNFNERLVKQFAYEDCVNQTQVLLAFKMKDSMHGS